MCIFALYYLYIIHKCTSVYSIQITSYNRATASLGLWSSQTIVDTLYISGLHQKHFKYIIPKIHFLIFMRKQMKHLQHQCLLVLLCSMLDSELVEFDQILHDADAQSTDKIFLNKKRMLALDHDLLHWCNTDLLVGFNRAWMFFSVMTILQTWH